jgi:uncharacterized RDD family membrane protein YckC
MGFMLIDQEEKTCGVVSQKANLLNRFIAKFIDFLVVALLYEIPLKISFLMGLVYLFIADGFVNGSIGKRLIGLRIVMIKDNASISFRESILRNIPLGIAYLSYAIPFVGGIIAAGIVALESLLMIGNPQGRRLGDEVAKTFVLNSGKA